MTNVLIPGVPVTLLALAATATSACGPRRVVQPSPSSRALIVLLPDPNGGPSERATVSNASGAVELNSPGEATRVVSNSPPSAAAPMDDAEVRRVFGSVLSDLPAAPQRFNLHFRLESDELTDESRAAVAEILRAVAARPVPDVTVIGHTDTTGDRAGNYQLGLKRALAVRSLLVKSGVDASLVETASHGEGDLLIPTPDGTVEPRNRRVEITVK